MRSTSSGHSGSIIKEIREEIQRLNMLISSGGHSLALKFNDIEQDINFYESVLLKYCNKHIKDATVLEIGHGQRPLRLIYLISKGVTCYGIDLDEVMLEGNLREIKMIFATSSFLRSIKTIIRFYLFDRRENRLLSKYMGNDVFRNSVKMARRYIITGDACDQSTWPKRPIDLIFSEDVFEHIPKERLEDLLHVMWERMGTPSVAIIRPMVWTGIKGSHVLEWYDTQHRPRKTKPWQHLLGDPPPVNTYLNRLTRRDYVNMFRRTGFHVVLDEPDNPNEGKEYLTDDIARMLQSAGYDEYEYMSNKVNFVLLKT